MDVVGVFAPNFARIEIMQEIADAVKAGAECKGLIMEKPLARNLQEADAILALARDMKVPAEDYSSVTVTFENPETGQ